MRIVVWVDVIHVLLQVRLGYGLNSNDAILVGTHFVQLDIELLLYVL